jgi:hypothetical protein
MTKSMAIFIRKSTICRNYEKSLNGTCTQYSRQGLNLAGRIYLFFSCGTETNFECFFFSHF